MRIPNDEVLEQSVEKTSGLIDSGSISAEDLTKMTLLKIREIEAVLRDQEQSDGLSRGLLHGIRFAAKDPFDVAILNSSGLSRYC